MLTKPWNFNRVLDKLCCNAGFLAMYQWQWSGLWLRLRRHAGSRLQIAPKADAKPGVSYCIEEGSAISQRATWPGAGLDFRQIHPSTRLWQPLNVLLPRAPSERGLQLVRRPVRCAALSKAVSRASSLWSGGTRCPNQAVCSSIVVVRPASPSSSYQHLRLASRQGVRRSVPLRGLRSRPGNILAGGPRSGPWGERNIQRLPEPFRMVPWS